MNLSIMVKNYKGKVCNMYQDEYKRWLAADLEDADLKPELARIEGNDDEIKDRFAVALKFGTAGLRGVLGAGTNRMNIYVVRQATQGLANWVKTQGGNQTVAISYDSRLKSDIFAKTAAGVLAANGIKVRIYDALMPVPALSFATRYYECNAGIMVTASHNPAKYNGYKAYGPDGCQMTDDAAAIVYDEIQKTDVLTGAKYISFAEGVEQGLIRFVGDDCKNALYAAIEARQVRPGLCKTAGLKLVYSPLNGSGLVPVTHVLNDMGVTDITIVPEQEYPNGYFTTCSYPNPEIFEALKLGLNLATVKMFGEMEFWFAMIKIVAIVALIVVGLVMVMMHFKSPTGVEASFAHLWNDGGWFPKGLSGFFAGFQIAVFAFVGIELVGTTAAETKDPEKSLPRAINSIPLRIIMFYVFALIVIMSVTPWSSVVPSKSPFVELFVLVGLPAAASLINFVVLTSAASSANSGVFSTSRMLFGLAQEGVAPKAFAKLSKRAVPAKGLTFSCICLLGGVVMLYVNPSVIGAFTMITTVSAILFMFVWTIILCSYLVYRKQRPHLHEKSIYKMPLGKLMCWVCMAFFVFVVVLLTLEDDTRQALLVTPLWFIALGLGWLFIGKKRAAELRK